MKAMNMIHQTERPCPVCQSREGCVLAQLDYALFDDLDLSGHKTLVQCNACGMFYDDVFFSERQLQEYYLRNEYYAESSIGGSGSVSEDNNVRYDRILDQLKLTPNSVVLDFGCGQGGFISRCIEYGLKAIGIESSEKSREAVQRAGFQVYESMDAFITENPICQIQAIVFSHVLEHLMYPLRFLNSIAKYCQDVLVYIEVPDADSYLSPRTVVKWQEMYFEHLSHFRAKNIEDLARISCIDILREGRTPFSELQKESQCLFIVGRLGSMCKYTDNYPSGIYKYDQALRHPFESIRSVLNSSRPLALWGISQYAMLFIGSCPEVLCQIRRLFDASVAKIGRRIRGIVIESSNNLSSLTDEYILLLPKSSYLFQMRSHLLSIGFRGQIIEV